MVKQRETVSVSKNNLQLKHCVRRRVFYTVKITLYILNKKLSILFQDQVFTYKNRNFKESSKCSAETSLM